MYPLLYLAAYMHGRKVKAPVRFTSGSKSAYFVCQIITIAIIMVMANAVPSMEIVLSSGFCFKIVKVCLTVCISFIDS